MTDHKRISFEKSWSRARLGALTACLLPALLLVACEPDVPGADDTIDRAVFIQTYIDLRMSALDTDSQHLADPARDSILAHNGVTAEDLLDFATAYSRDTEFMRDVWVDIESELDRRPGSEE